MRSAKKLACSRYARLHDHSAYGEVLDILMQPRRDKRAAKKFFRKLLKGLKLGLSPRFSVPAGIYGRALEMGTFEKIIGSCTHAH